MADKGEDVITLLSLLGAADGWLRSAFGDGPEPPRTPSVRMTAGGEWMRFKVEAEPGATPIALARLDVASRIDTTPEAPCDFESVPLYRAGSDLYGFVRVGQVVACGPPLSPANVLYFASITDAAGNTVTSRMYRGTDALGFGPGFAPTIERWNVDGLPVPPPPGCGAP